MAQRDGLKKCPRRKRRGFCYSSTAGGGAFILVNGLKCLKIIPNCPGMDLFGIQRKNVTRRGKKNFFPFCNKAVF